MSYDRIAVIKNRLKEIEKEKLNLLSELARLKNKTLNDFSPEEKINIYKNLFKGRNDVYARFWDNKRGKRGYAPVKNPNGEYIPLTDEVIKYHLYGINPIEPLYYGEKRDFIVGIYPMLKNDKCCFLAIDFDAKHSDNNWKEEVSAFIATCEKLDIPAYIEISRSGKGAHIWIFFEDEISAANARRLGTLILTISKENNLSIDFKTYDRLFPNQDTMPKGGFGNLIALPLQKKYRKDNKTVFVNKQFEPYPNQWEFLNNAQKMSEHEINLILKTYAKPELENTFCDKNNDSPWKLPQRVDLSDIKLPEKINMVLSNKIYIEKNNLDPKLFHNILKMAAFHNPEFYRAQAMRFSTYDKPRIICCGEISEKFLIIPRGCYQELITLLNNLNIHFETQDERLKGSKIKVTFSGKLLPEQTLALKNVIDHDFGIVSAPTAFGKTVLASKIIAKRKVSTLILTHRKQLAEQWQDKLKEFLGIDCGMLGGGKNKLTGVVDIAIMQTLMNKENLAEILSDYGQLIADECHHLAAYKFEQIAKEFRGKYVLGLTATFERKDGHHPIIQMQCGEVVYKVKTVKNNFDKQLKVCFTDFDYLYAKEDFDINDAYKTIINDKKRNEQIVRDIKNALHNKRACLVMSERTEHVGILAKLLENTTQNLFILTGKIKPKELKSKIERIKNVPAKDELLIIATGKYIGEGFDEPRLDTLFLTMPISWKGTLTQYTGRLNRECKNKKNSIIYDYADINIPIFDKMYKKRLRTYKELGYMETVG